MELSDVLKKINLNYAESKTRKQAVIVAGASLTQISSDNELREQFLKSAE